MQADELATPRYATVHVDVSADESDEASALLFELGATGVEERDASTLVRPTAGAVLLVAHFDDEDQAKIAAEAVPYEARVEYIVGDAWRERWKEFFKPTRIGERLVVRPSWEPVEAGPNDIVLTLDPGQAFGTGTHETTRLVLGELETRVRGGEHVLDVGCGSGILAIAALLFGAKDAVAIDQDELAVHATDENAEANGVADRVEASTTDLAAITTQYDLVLANIESRVLLPVADALIATVKTGGTLILSGLLEPEEDELRARYGALRFVHTRKERDWITMVFERDGAPASTAR